MIILPDTVAPAGVGFSYSDNSNDYPDDDKTGTSDKSG